MSDSAELIRTRKSLLSKLKNWEDAGSWREFFDLYWKLIYNCALHHGLGSSESQDVVQETLLSVAKNIDSFRYDERRGSFKNWLLNTTRWRIQDQLRKQRKKMQSMTVSVADLTACEIPVEEDALQTTWDSDWEKALMQGAIERTKRAVSPKHFQIFDLVVLREWPVKKVASSLKVSTANVYLIKHRVGARMKLELRKIQEEFQ